MNQQVASTHQIAVKSDRGPSVEPSPPPTRIPLVMAVTGAGLGAVGMVMMLTTGGAVSSWNDGVEHNVLTAMCFAVIVWILGRVQPHNRLIWVSAWVALLTGLYAGIDGITWIWGYLRGITATGDFAPADLPDAIALVKALTIPASIVGLFTMVTFGILLFPDGRPPTPRWRHVGWLAVMGMAISTWSFAYAFRPSVTTPYQDIKAAPFSLGDGIAANLSLLGVLLMISATLLSAVAFVSRWRHSRGQIRQQLKWVGFGYVMLALTFLLAFALSGSQNWTLLVVFGAGIAFAGFYAVAVARYRLYDIDVVISRAFVYGTLAVFITVAYVGLVVGIGSLFGGGTDNALLSLLATALVAVLFQPLRRRLQHVANRMVYGRLATPYEVLSDLARRVGALDDDLSSDVARSLVEGTGADSSGVWVASGDGVRLAAAWPADAHPNLEEATATAQVTHGGERLGILTLSAPAGQRLQPNDHRLLAEVAAGMGLALRNLQLTDDLRRNVVALRESRRRIVAVQDETRRRLERDLHDGAQQQLVALKVKLGLARSLIASEDAPRTTDLLEELTRESDVAIDAMRDFARGVYPALLESEGLAPALTARARKWPVPVLLDVEGVGRYPREVETTIYFCVLEALHNVARHATASMARLQIREESGVVSFEVTDDGVGFNPILSRDGTGLSTMADRLEAIEGVLEIDSTPDTGTTIRGLIPVLGKVTA